MKSKYIYFVVLLIIVGILLYNITKNNKQNLSISPFCTAVNNIYSKRYFGSEIQYCQESGINYFMIESFGIEGGSGRVFFGIDGNKIGSINQYGEGDGTLPKYPSIEGKNFNGISCNLIDLKNQCGIIDLGNFYRGKNGLKKDSEFAKTCKNAIQKMKILPYIKNRDQYELEGRYFMCTNDKEVFYIGFTGDKIGNDKSSSYKNYNKIQFYSLEGNMLGNTSNFKLDTDGDILNHIYINDNQKGIFQINRCTNMPIGDCE